MQKKRKGNCLFVCLIPQFVCTLKSASFRFKVAGSCELGVGDILGADGTIFCW